jgi:hypothetical protein
MDTTLLPLDDPRWKSMGYGIANNLKRLLDANDETAEQTWDALEAYQYLDHQGTVYDRTFAALPHIVEAAGKLSVGSPTRIAMLYFVGAAASDGKLSIFDDPSTPDRFGSRAAVLKAGTLIGQSLLSPQSDENVQSLFYSIALIRGNARLQNAVGCMFGVICPKCGSLVDRA